ncbi:MAG: MBOAT family O-acyltransferase [Candidatus Obscuribacterales bacterium]|nr:MBOAT family O-acyltransferase [Candidatus Obscuribacterales bacterium]
MLFNSLQYLLFLPAVVTCFWLSGKRFRPLILLCASYYFYMSWYAPYCLLLAALTTLNYLLGRSIDKAKGQSAKRKFLFGLGLVLNLGCLLFFKYTNFLVDCCSSLLRTVPHNTAQLSLPLQIIVPLAISFFVFEFVHYLGDIYSGQKPIDSPIRFALFAAFFPSQIAGPIKRFEDFDTQILHMRSFSSPMFLQGINLILEGLFKKVALGDNLVPIVEKGFSSIQYLAPVDAWIAALAFTFEIYYDFSGYTDIGRGSAMLLGINLPENFNKPYFSVSLIDFWRRWHMSLSSWLRDYLYKPLGGSRGGTFARNRNLLITMLLGGLWHGASWHFVIWGAFHGIGLIVNHTFRKLFPAPAETVSPNSNTTPTIGLKSLATGLFTFVFVILGWILFRADTFENALSFYKHMFVAAAPCFESGFLVQAFIASTLPAAFSLYALFHGLTSLHQHLSTNTNFGQHWWLKIKPTPVILLPGYAAYALLILCLASKKAAPFIYFQF